MRFLMVFLMLAVVLPASAHHPFTPYYDGSKLEVVTGVIEEVRISNPHVVLIVNVSSPEGRKGRWGFEGLPPHVFSNKGVDLKSKLQPGMQVTLSGWPAMDPSARFFSGREITFPDKSTMSFGPTPSEADEWRCSSGPCTYKYPPVPSR